MEVKEIAILKEALNKWSSENLHETTVSTSSSGLNRSMAYVYMQNNIHTDYSVTVETEVYPCHRSLLEASSDFFQALFRSGMQESQTGHTELKDMPGKVFATILKMIYTGDANLIDADNVLDIWHHAHFLQIHGVLQECEEYAIRNVSCENCFQFYHASRAYHSERALATLYVFMSNNLEKVASLTEFVLLMTPGLLLCLLREQYLSISHEDVAINALIKWMKVDHKTNSSDEICTEDLDEYFSIHRLEMQAERKEYLCELLISLRLWTASSECLERISKEDLIESSDEALSIVRQALMYKNGPYLKHVSWPLQATHRNSSPFQHALVIMTDAEIYVHSLRSQELYPAIIQYPVRQSGINMFSMVVSNNEIYVEAESTYWSVMKKLSTDREWENVINDDSSYTIADSPSKLIAFNGQIYRYFSNSLQVLTVNEAWEHNTWNNCSAHKLGSVDLIAPWDDSLVFFKVDTDSTKVCCLDVKTDTLSEEFTLEGKSKRIVTFIHEDNFYVLQGDGNIWIAIKEKDGTIHFKSIAKLWDGSWEIFAAVIFNEDLYICGSNSRPPLQNKENYPSDIFFLNSVNVVLYDDVIGCQPIIVDKNFLF